MSYSYEERSGQYNEKIAIISSSERISGTDSAYTVNLDGLYQDVYKVDIISYAYIRPALAQTHIGIECSQLKNCTNRNDVTFYLNNVDGFTQIGGVDYIARANQNNSSYMTLYSQNYETFDSLTFRFINPITLQAIVMPGISTFVLRFRMIKKGEFNNIRA
jgi:hypothetical protein